MVLKRYNEKRDFGKTPEPAGKIFPEGKQPRFVIQKHAASRLHYDFRLELGGVLKSWACPKGISYAHGEKRLAVEVEDHPVSYKDFEGVIPKGQYGGGTVMVWDTGTFEPLSPHPLKELESGKLHFVLHGKKLEGEWYLVRLRRGEKQWLIIRGGADMKPISKKLDDTSALSGKSMAQLGKGDRVWRSNREVKGEVKNALKGAVKSVRARVSKAISPLKASASKSSRIGFIEPMKAQLVDSPPPGDWTYEIKFDGFRALALVENGGVRLLSRNEKDLGEKFPEIADAVARLKVRSAVLDGEIVALDKKGRSSFQLLQAFELGQERPPIFYYVFDLPRLNGDDLRGLSLVERKARLKRLLKKPPKALRYSASLEGDVVRLLQEARKAGLEGLIGKRKDSVYETGRRSGAWIKLKILQEQEFVIGGYSDPEGSRTHFGALLIGVYEGKFLKFMGKVGTGFNEALLSALHEKFLKIPAEKCPFSNLPENRSGRYRSGITAPEMKRCHWVKPEIVCQVKFSEWTRDGKLRQPVFLGLREDKEAREVARERPRHG